jgi:hypothetical protein
VKTQSIKLSPISSKIKTHVVSHYLLDQPAPLENQDVVCSCSVVGVVSDQNAGFLSKKSLNGLELVDGWGSVEETGRKEAQRAFKFQRSVPVVSLSVCLSPGHYRKSTAPVLQGTWLTPVK